MRELKIGTSGVRGVVGDALTPELVVNFACAFGVWANGGAVVIGRDTRRSSPMFRSAVVSGLLSQGCECIDLGIAPTPLVSFAVRELGAAGGLSITGSHNDARWNALKFIGPDGTLLNAVKSQELLDVFHASAFAGNALESFPAVAGAPDVIERYLEYVLSAIDLDLVRPRHFRVAVDFRHGSCIEVLTRFLEALGCRVVPVNDTPDFQFGQSLASGARELAGIMPHLDADVGVSVNVDGDRVAFATPDGTALSEECSLPLVAEARLQRRPGLIVTNQSTSRMVDVVAARYGQRVLRTSVGEGHVVDAGLEEGAVLAGEGSGGVGVLPLAMTFDAALALAVVLELMASAERGPSEILQTLPRLVMRKGALPCAPDQVYKILEEFRVSFADQAPNVDDGVRVEWPDAWLHVRASNTEPLLRIIVEAETEIRAEALFESALARGRKAAHRRGGI